MEKENNVLIDIFMTGREVTPSGKLMGRKRGYPKEYENWYDTTEITNLKYHTSWDRLIPVVQKICTLGFDVCIENSRTYISEGTPQGDGGKFFNIISDVEGLGMLQNIYKSVIKFIEWHNSQKS